jgi:large subunit ribosomal protein L3
MDHVQVVHTIPRDKGRVSLQLGIVNQKPHRVSKPLLGHFAKHNVTPKKNLQEFIVPQDASLEPGTTLGAVHFVPGQYVDVTAPSIGKGFQGGMKRWGFKGGRATHGTSLAHRSLGSTGQHQDVTVQNLKVVKVDSAENVLYVRGAVPGHDGQYVRIKDAIKKGNLGKLVPAGESVPFPTYNEQEHGKVDRIRVAKMGGMDPFIAPKE